MGDWIQSVLRNRRSPAVSGWAIPDDLCEWRDNLDRVDALITARWILLITLTAYAAVAASILAVTSGIEVVLARAIIPANALILAVIYNAVSSRLRPFLASIPTANLIQFTLDVVLVTVVVVSTGVAGSWFWIIYVLLIFEAAIIVPERADVWRIATVIALIIMLMNWGAYVGWLPTLPLPISSGAAWTDWQVVAVRSLWQVFIVVGSTALTTTVIVRQREQLSQTRAAAFIDDQTGMYSREYFRRMLEIEVARAKRSGRTMHLALIDIDNLGPINTRFGLNVGDAVIARVADLVRDGFSQFSSNGLSANTVARFSGEEFGALIVEDANAPGGQPDAESVLAAVESIVQQVSCSEVDGVTVTVSAGVATLGPGVDSAEELLVLADDALFFSADHGGNQVSSCEDVDHVEADAELVSAQAYS